MKTTDKKTIFLVDDDIDIIYQMTTMLENMDYNVVSAVGQKEAEAMMNTMSRPDLAILDLMMENKDSGFILSHRLKNRFPGIQVIIATALTAETGMMFSLEDRDDKNWIQADLYLEKGIRPDQLQREIHKLLKI